MQDTNEQHTIVDCAIHGKNISVKAGPGTGKTYTAKKIANSLVNNRGAYLAFNESTARSAAGKFPSNFKPQTTNSFAFNQMKQFLSNREIKGLNGYQIASILDLPPMPFGTPSTYGYFISQTLFNFCNSADKNMMMKHVPDIGRNNDSEEFKTLIAQHATDLFCMICDQNSQLPIAHNVYMKLWQLSEPKLNLDTIIIDEAQDQNPVSWDVFSKQDAQIILFGDQYQQINAWRGGMNVMDMLPNSASLSLTKSFRFGKEVAQVANCLLQNHFASPFRLSGNENINSVIGKLDDVDYKLNIFRTNAGMISDLMDPENNGKKIFINGKHEELKKLLASASELKEGKNVSVGDFKRFRNWDEAVDFAKTQAGSHLMKIIGIVNKHNTHHVNQALDKAASVTLKGADKIYSTCHSIKGFEAKSVRVGGDFISPQSPKWSEAESNLIYVAITRSMKYLDESLVRKSIQTLSHKALEFRQAQDSKKQLAAVDLPKPQVVQEIDFGQLVNKPGAPF